MNEAFQVIFGLLGGLSIFLFGMNMMSDPAEGGRRENEEKSWDATVNPIMGSKA